MLEFRGKSQEKEMLQQMKCKIREHNYAQQQFSGWEFSIESQIEGLKNPITNTH